MLKKNLAIASAAASVMGLSFVAFKKIKSSTTKFSISPLDSARIQEMIDDVNTSQHKYIILMEDVHDFDLISKTKSYIDNESDYDFMVNILNKYYKEMVKFLKEEKEFRESNIMIE